MSGIVGIWNLHGEPVSESLLDRLSRPLAHRGPDGEGRWMQGPVGLACHLFHTTPESLGETQPFVDRAGAVLVFDGRLDNREELLERLRDAHPVHRASPDPELVLAAYRAAGLEFIKWLAGDFALALFDPSCPALVLARDAIGMRPLSYCRIGGTFLFASEIKAILAHPDVRPSPNDELLADFLFDRIYHQELTFFSGIFNVLPSQQVILTPERLRKQSYWDFTPRTSLRFRSLGEYAEAYREQFTRAVRRRLRSQAPVGVLVSGGLDSSSIFCLAQTLSRQGTLACPRVVGISNLFPEGMPSNEERFLDDIERRYGTSIERIPFWPLGLPEQSADEVWHIESPFLDELWGSTHRALQAAQQVGARVLLTGHWGDQFLFSQSYLIDLARTLRWRTVRSHLREFGTWLTDVEPRWFYRRFLIELVKYHTPDLLRPLVRRLRRRKDGPWFPDALRHRASLRLSQRSLARPRFGPAYPQALYEEIRAGYHVFCMEWSNKVGAMHGLEMAFPFLDRDLIAFMMSIPGEAHAAGGVPKRLLREALRGVLPEEIAQRHWKADFTHLVNETMDREYERLFERLTAKGHAIRRGYLNGSTLKQSLEPLRSGLLKDGADCQSAWILWDFLSLELWLELFFESEHERGIGVPSTQEVAHET